MNDAYTFVLAPATREDIGRLAHIHVVACLPDNAFQLYFATPTAFKRAVTEMLEGQIGDPTWQYVKAVDKKTGELAAWASWTGLVMEHTFRNPNPRAEFDFPAGLPIYVQKATEEWLSTWASGTHHILCEGLFTDPLFQRRGMGTALVEYGNQLADQLGLPIFLQGSPFGYPIYVKHGFETVQHLDLDLREWVPEAKSDDKGYGNYRFYYMLRLPQTLLETS